MMITFVEERNFLSDDCTRTSTGRSKTELFCWAVVGNAVGQEAIKFRRCILVYPTISLSFCLDDWFFISRSVFSFLLVFLY